MNQRIVWIITALIVAGVVIGAIVISNRPPSSLDGDPWDYNIMESDLPEGWSVSSADLQTAYDVAREGALSAMADMRASHFIEFAEPTAGDVFYLTSQVVLFDSAEAAKAAMAAEAASEEWEKIEGSRTVGDETVVWRLKPVADAPEQVSYRADFRYLNGVVSVAMTGTVGAVKDDGPVLVYAGKVWAKMRELARPDALDVLSNARHPDLRGLVLSQNDLAQADPNFGDRWVFNSSLLPSWTPNSGFPDPDGMAKLGRVMGYQVYLVKPLTDDELKSEFSTGLFQQATAFTSAENAEQTLAKMVGLEGGLWTNAPTIGESAKGWTQEYQSQGTSAGSGVVAATEITFRVGTYIGSIRIQTSPVIQPKSLEARASNEHLAQLLANALAEKLKNAEK
ncbi:MAG: hypothetical protein FJ030_13375 [Chloroflexi bacterium]|nr:hypothetical protein [Chloroflexota bacterium]